MVDFSNVSKQKVSSENTAVYELYDIDMEGASLVVAPSTRSNKPYNNALLKMMLPQQRRLQGGKTTPEFIEKHRQDLIPLYAKHVVKGWNNVVDAKGKEAPFSAENAESFLNALPAQTFDQLLEFCENEANFREGDPQELAKNSAPS